LLEQSNSGVAAARNTGARASTGDVLSFLDADDSWSAEKLAKEVEVFKGGVISTAMREFRGEETLSIRKASPLGWVANRFQKGMAVVSGSSFSVKRDIFDQLNGFDEARDIHPSEDWEFLFRASQICEMNVVEEPLVNYRIHGGNAHLKIRNTENSMKAVFRKIFNGKQDRESYGNLYSILAGSYFHAKDYARFVTSAAKALYYRPQLLMDRLNKRN
jgi:glycosyltransferase involved in cell wall biosynthesis